MKQIREDEAKATLALDEEAAGQTKRNSGSVLLGLGSLHLQWEDDWFVSSVLRQVRAAPADRKRLGWAQVTWHELRNVRLIAWTRAACYSVFRSPVRYCGSSHCRLCLPDRSWFSYRWSSPLRTPWLPWGTRGPRWGSRGCRGCRRHPLKPIYVSIRVWWSLVSDWFCLDKKRIIN